LISEDEEIILGYNWPGEDEELEQEIKPRRSLGDDLSEGETPSEETDLNNSYHISSSSGQLIQITAMSSKVDIGGEEIEISNTRIKATSDMMTLYPKTDRKVLKKENKLNELLEKATKLLIPKLELISRLPYLRKISLMTLII
jgi:hypothetical protein